MSIKEYQNKRYHELIQYKKEAIKNSSIILSAGNIKMGEKTLKCNSIRVNKKECHKFKQAIELDSVDTKKTVVSDSFRHSEEGFKYFTVYQEHEIVKPLYYITTNECYIKYFKNGGKNMSLLIKNIEVWEKYEDIWGVIKNKLNIKFHSEPIYENKYLKAKVREFDGSIKTNFAIQMIGSSSLVN